MLDVQLPVLKETKYFIKKLSVLKLEIYCLVSKAPYLLMLKSQNMINHKIGGGGVALPKEIISKVYFTW